MLVQGVTIKLKGFVPIGKREEIVTHLPEEDQRIWTGITEGHYPLIVLAKIRLTESDRLISFLFLSWLLFLFGDYDGRPSAHCHLLIYFTLLWVYSIVLRLHLL